MDAFIKAFFKYAQQNLLNEWIRDQTLLPNSKERTQQDDKHESGKFGKRIKLTSKIKVEFLPVKFINIQKHDMVGSRTSTWQLTPPRLQQTVAPWPHRLLHATSAAMAQPNIVRNPHTVANRGVQWPCDSHIRN